MLFLDLCDKEVININDCSCLGHVGDVEFDPVTGRICSIIIPGPGRLLKCFCRDYDFCIPWAKIIKIGPDIILVNVCEEEKKHKI